MDFLAAFMSLVNSKEELIVKLNTQDQIFGKGIDRKGVKLNPLYADSTFKRYKKSRRVPNLKIKGNYLDSYKVTTTKDKVDLRAFREVKKGFDLADHLRKRYNPEGLTVENEMLVGDQIVLELINIANTELIRKTNEL